VQLDLQSRSWWYYTEAQWDRIFMICRGESPPPEPEPV
jgi:hypothetical protein